MYFIASYFWYFASYLQSLRQIACCTTSEKRQAGSKQLIDRRMSLMKTYNNVKTLMSCMIVCFVRFVQCPEHWMLCVHKFSYFTDFDPCDHVTVANESIRTIRWTANHEPANNLTTRTTSSFSWNRKVRIPMGSRGECYAFLQSLVSWVLPWVNENSGNQSVGSIEFGVQYALSIVKNWRICFVKQKSYSFLFIFTFIFLWNAAAKMPGHEQSFRIT